ncbi:GerAB/ArcD/ProY family transporter [Mycoplasmatota bacterium]|nr:GerAB/ArcD/ProY family transporter [Mycoplasmatota bacterium]
MEKGKGKISIRQVMFLFVVTVYTPSVRFVAGYSAGKAKQAAWLTPLVTLIPFLVLIYVLNALLQKYKGLSFMDIIYDVTSRFWGKIILLLYLVWLTVLLALYVRFYAERLVTSIYPNVNMNLFTISMLLIVAIIIRAGIVAIARMNEIIFLIELFVILSLFLLMIPTIKTDYLTPISSMDIVPVMKGSIGNTGLIYITYLFFFSDRFSRTKEFIRYSLYAGIFLWLVSTIIIITSVGTLGHSIVGRSPLSFLIAVKNISLLGVLSGFESILVASWILTDFILIIVFTYSIMNITKSLLNLRDFKPFINIFFVILYLLTWILGVNVFELQAFSADFAIQMNLLMQVIVPILIFFIAKIRKKV